MTTKKIRCRKKLDAHKTTKTKFKTENWKFQILQWLEIMLFDRENFQHTLNFYLFMN